MTKPRELLGFWVPPFVFTLLFMMAGLTKIQADTGIVGKSTRADSIQETTLKTTVSKQFSSQIDAEIHAYNLYAKRGDTAAMARSLHTIGALFCREDQFAIGIRYYFRAQNLFRTLGDSLWVANEYNDIAFAYLYWDDYSTVVNYYNRALALYQQLDNQQEIALAEANLGFVYSKMGQPTKALLHHQKAYKIYLLLNDTANYAKIYHGLGDAFRLSGNYKQALKYFALSTRFAPWSANKLQIGQNLLREAEILIGLGQYSKASYLLERSYQELKKRRSGKWLKNYLEVKVNLAEITDDQAGALKALKALRVIEDSLFGQRQQSEITGMLIEHQTREKEEQLATLQTNFQLASERIRFRDRLILIGLAALLIMSLIVMAVVQQSRKRKEAYRMLVEKNQQLLNFQAICVEPYTVETQEKTVDDQKESKADDTQIYSSIAQETNEDARLLIARLDRLMEKEKLFLNPTLRLTDLCRKLKTNSTTLSHAVNKLHKKNFNTYLNEFRIREAQHCIARGDYRHLSMDGLANKAGFSNRVTFSAAFKKITGVPPSFYIQTLQSKKQALDDTD
ncbi:MAG: AraC family transcriptional regulator [Bacteroidales bacterium]|nr:AraC family transcriptional regulator [Bacteroidales bacterium]MDD3666478.1 AraC family transcriptional regulator [Bacteroidales bacterium]